MCWVTFKSTKTITIPIIEDLMELKQITFVTTPVATATEIVIPASDTFEVTATSAGASTSHKGSHEL